MALRPSSQLNLRQKMLAEGGNSPFGIVWKEKSWHAFKYFYSLAIKSEERVKLEPRDQKNLLINEVNIFIGDAQRSAPCNYTETVIIPG